MHNSDARQLPRFRRFHFGGTHGIENYAIYILPIREICKSFIPRPFD